MNKQPTESDATLEMLEQLEAQDERREWWRQRLRAAAEARGDAAAIAVLRRYEVLVHPLLWEALFGEEPPKESDGDLYGGGLLRFHPDRGWESSIDAFARLIGNCVSREIRRRYLDDEDR
jgi:hypothetical protein